MAREWILIPADRAGAGEPAAALKRYAAAHGATFRDLGGGLYELERDPGYGLTQVARGAIRAAFGERSERFLIDGAKEFHRRFSEGKSQLERPQRPSRFPEK